MGYELTIDVDNYKALEYDHPYFYHILEDFKEEQGMPDDQVLFTKEDILNLREYCYQTYINPNYKKEPHFDYETDGERLIDFIRDITILLKTFPSIPQYKILYN